MGAPVGNRHVPFICGIFAIGLATWVVFNFEGWWRFLIGAFLLAFGCASIKTAIWATDTEISELTKPGPVSRKTNEKFQERLSLLGGFRREEMDHMQDRGIDAAGKWKRKD
jgi:hypothetical protein